MGCISCRDAAVLARPSLAARRGRVDRCWVVRVPRRGRVLLAYLGVRSLIARPLDPNEAATHPPTSHARAFASTVALTMANPATILSFAAAFAALGARIATRASAPVFASSVLVGSMAWWVGLRAG